MAKVTVHGDGRAFQLYSLDGMFQEYELHEGVNNISEGDYTFTLVAREGYEIVQAYYFDSMLQQIFVDSGEFYYYLDSFGLEIYIKTEQKAPEREVSGFNKLYKVDTRILNLVAGERFVGDGVDLGNYIINVLELPFSLSESELGHENPIRLGSYALNSKAFEIIRDSVTIDLGEIYVPRKHNNSYDYMNTDALLHLPFSNAIDLDLEYVIGCHVGVKYVLDLYSGYVTINISSSRVNKVIRSETLKIGRDIPFIRRVGGDTINQLSTSGGVNNGVLTPFIELVRNKIHNESSIFKNDVTIYEQLKNLKGYVSVSNIILNTRATSGEKDSIINQLRNGVFIK